MNVAAPVTANWVSAKRVREIVTELNAYRGDNLWRDVIDSLPEYAASITDDNGTRDDQFRLIDGSVIVYHPDRKAWGEYEGRRRASR
jgi:hypothetical protein